MFINPRLNSSLNNTIAYWESQCILAKYVGKLPRNGKLTIRKPLSSSLSYCFDTNHHGDDAVSMQMLRFMYNAGETETFISLVSNSSFLNYLNTTLLV